MAWEPPSYAYLPMRGVKIGYYDSGELYNYESLLILFFLHGMPGQISNWRYQLEFFEKKYRCVAIDMRGYGKSEKPKEVKFENFLLDLDAFMEEKRISSKNTILLGHSFGAMVAQMYASQKRLKGLVLVGSLLKHKRDTMDWIILHSPSFLWKPLFFTLNPLTVRLYRKIYFSPKVSDSIYRTFMEDNKEYIENIPPHVFRYVKILEKYDATDFLPKITSPTCVIAASDDVVTPPEENQQIAQLIPKSEYHEVKDAGHMLLYEKPDEVNSIIEGFISKL